MAVKGLITKLFTVVCALKNMYMYMYMSVFGAEGGEQVLKEVNSFVVFVTYCSFCFISLLKMLMLLLLVCL